MNSLTILKHTHTHTPQVVGVGGFEQVLRARAFLLLEENVVFGVAVWAHRAMFTAAAPGGLALQLHRQGNVVDVVYKNTHT